MTMITGLGLQTNKNNKRLLRATNSLISAMKSTIKMANQRARIGMTMAIAMAIVMMSMNKQMLGNA